MRTPEEEVRSFDFAVLQIKMAKTKQERELMKQRYHALLYGISQEAAKKLIIRGSSIAPEGSEYPS